MICKKCNTENVDNAAFCCNCGANLAEAPKVAPAPAPAPAPRPVVVQVENKNTIPSEYKPVSAWGYVGLNILYCIPIVGFIFLMIHTFSGSNLNRRSYARSYWCSLLLGIIISLIVVIVAVIIAAISGIALGELAYYY